jgi:hypothetical protein
VYNQNLYLPDTSTFFIPIGLENTDTLLLTTNIQLPNGWFLSITHVKLSTGWSSPGGELFAIECPDSLIVNIIHPQIVPCNDTGKVTIWAFNVYDEFKGIAELMVYSVGMKGDADTNDLVNASDLTMIMNYEFLFGPSPILPETAELTNDGKIDIADLTRLVDYLYGSQEPFVCEVDTGYTEPDIQISAQFQNDTTRIYLNSPVNLRGLELAMSGPAVDTVINMLGGSIDLIYGQSGDSLRVGLLDTNGFAVINAGYLQVLNIPGNYQVEEAFASDMDFHSQPVNIGMPQIAVLPESFSKIMPIDTVLYDTIIISNNGTASLAFQVHSIYSTPGSRDNVILHYDGDNHTAIGWDTSLISPTVAVRFPCALTLPYAGMFMNSVDIYMQDQGSGFTLKVWNMGTEDEPGNLIISQPFTVSPFGWNKISLSDPVYLTGSDIWVGYSFIQNGENLSIPGTDAGPHHPEGDYLNTGTGWNHLSSNSAYDFNWNIRANLSGQPIYQWLYAQPDSASISPSDSAEIVLSFDATGLEAGTYNAVLRFTSNDLIFPVVDIPVEIDVVSECTWTGSVDRNWYDYRNWNCQIVPTQTIKVTIPIQSPGPVIDHGIAYCKYIDVKSFSNLKINSTATLIIKEQATRSVK